MTLERAAYQRQAAKLECLEEKLWKQERLNYQLLNRVQELQMELEQVRDGQGEVTAGEARRDSRNSGLPPSLDLPSVKAANAVKRTRSLRRKSGKSVGGQAGHKGATLQQVEFPDRVRVHAPQKCRRCARSLVKLAVVGCHRRQVFDVPPIALEITEHWAQTKRCDVCGVRTKAKFPPGVNAPVQYGERVRAIATYLQKYQLLPFARTSEAMRDLFACSISPGCVETTRHRAAAKLVSVEEQIKSATKSSSVIGADETGLRVAGKMWVITNIVSMIR